MTACMVHEIAEHLPTVDEMRAIVVAAIVGQLRTTKQRDKKRLLQFRLREAMYGVGYLELSDGTALQWVKKPSVKCGSCQHDIEYRSEVEIIYPEGVRLITIRFRFSIPASYAGKPSPCTRYMRAVACGGYAIRVSTAIT